MSRRLLSPHRRIPSVTEDNPYQPTTSVNQFQYDRRINHRPRNGNHTVTVDTGLSDDTYTDSYSYCDYQHNHPNQDGRYYTDRSFSDDSGSTRLPCHYENDDESVRRFSRNTFSSDRSHNRSKRTRARGNPPVHKVYPQPADLRVYQEINACDNLNSAPSAGPRRAPLSTLSDRPQSSSSGAASAMIVDGCGGKCQTFENVCYFFLQLIFMMGILIGVSLCIAGLVLRKSAARNLQVLVYVGVLLALVSGVLLAIQWNSRNHVKKRKLAVRNAKRTPIQLETLHRVVQQPLMVVQEGQRVVPQILRPLPPQPDQQGIPWWRRKDLQ